MGDIFNVRCESPHMTEWIFDRAGPIAVELIGRRLLDRTSSSYSLRDCRITVWDINAQADGSAIERRWRRVFGLFIAQHYFASVNLQFRMVDHIAAGIGHLQGFGCVERFLVEG